MLLRAVKQKSSSRLLPVLICYPMLNLTSANNDYGYFFIKTVYREEMLDVDGRLNEAFSDK